MKSESDSSASIVLKLVNPLLLFFLLIVPNPPKEGKLSSNEFKFLENAMERFICVEGTGCDCLK